MPALCGTKGPTWCRLAERHVELRQDPVEGDSGGSVELCGRGRAVCEGQRGELVGQSREVGAFWASVHSP